jgi:hypothetical protein
VFVEFGVTIDAAAAAAAGMSMTGDGRIGECDLAALLGMQVETLAKRRQEGRAPVHYRLALGTSRISYAIRDVANWVVAHRWDQCPD